MGIRIAGCGTHKLEDVGLEDMKRIAENQVSESIICGIILALSGGCMDAYSYLYRGEVFANAQTGNMLLFGVNLAGGNFSVALKYLWPVLAFTLGIIIAEMARNSSEKLSIIHWRQITTAVEAIFLIGVAFIPQSYDSIANAIISFVCGIQVESFKKIRGNSIATTMCIGNLRSGTYYLSRYRYTGNVEYLKKGLLYFCIIVSFIVGAVGESLIVIKFEAKSVIVSSILLFTALALMFRHPLVDEGDAYIEG